MPVAIALLTPASVAASVTDVPAGTVIEAPDCPAPDSDVVSVVGGGVITCESACVVELDMKLPSPLYVAEIACVPALSVDVVNVAVVTPALVDTGLVPSVAEPSVKVTVPVGPEPEAGVTVAVNVTDAPNAAGVPDVPSVVAVVARVTPTDAGGLDVTVL